jgi:hypothetical protein
VPGGASKASAWSNRWALRLLARRLAFTLGGGRFAHDAVDPLFSRFLGIERQPELLAGHGCKEATHRVLLPTGCLHDGSDRCALWALEHADDPILLAAAAFWCVTL